ncbi:subtilisin-like serine protease [Dinochytrium kinnereticum]|nr:subtilisin-like serine protease [Dinochytrium kinnereticum]
MRFFAILALAVGACINGVVAIPVFQKPGSKIPNQYIVVFKNNADPAIVSDHEAWLSASALAGSGAPVFKRADLSAFPQIPQYTQFGWVQKYDGANKFRGYAAKISPEIAATLKSLPEVELVEQDTVVSIVGGGGGNPVPTSTVAPTATVVPTGTPAPVAAPWGLRRIAKADLPLPSTYTFNAAAGAGVDAYVIDTGVLVSHPDFQGRAKVGISYSSDNNDVDGNGHGTHVAGTIGSFSYGVAKKVNLIAVKVLSSSGSGTNSDVIAGVNWVARTAPTTGRKSVANMSLGGGASAALDNAVAAAVSAGVSFVVAAGNNGRDACSNSPARAPTAFTVAASDINDAIASFSDRGTCVDIVAPGVNVLSTWNNGATRSISGTSMASPHVAGVFAVALSAGVSGTPADVGAYVTSLTVPNKITGLTSTTKNLLLQVPQ